MKKETDHDWLIQTILWDEILSKFKADDLDYIDSLAWHYTQITQRYIPHKAIMAALKTIGKELKEMKDKHFNKYAQENKR